MAMHRPSSRLAAVLLSTAALAAQSPFAVGTRDVAWPNTTGQGAASLTARVHYPATAAGANAPVLPRAGGWPVVVFLHGFATIGSNYGALGNAWAARGFVAVLGNTSQFDNVGQERDGRALFPAVVAANGTGPFAGMFDVQRIALAGYSMGGGNVGNVLANNPGYRCGFAIAPVAPRGNNGALVTVPVAIVAGEGDTIAPWQTYAQPFYASLTTYAGLKQLYLLDGSATHTNMAGLFVSGGTGAEVFSRVERVGAGFLAHFLDTSTTALEQGVGPTALAEPRLTAALLEVATPQVWLAAPLSLGATTRLSVAAEPGLGGVLAAFSSAGPVPTPIGDLRLDPATAFVAVLGVAGAARRIDGQATVPNDPAFLGLRIAMQAVGIGRGSTLTLGNAIETFVQ